MIWYWTHDERGERTLTAQEVFADLRGFQEDRKRGDNPREALIDNVEKFLSVAGVTVASLPLKETGLGSNPR